MLFMILTLNLTIGELTAQAVSVQRCTGDLLADFEANVPQH
jgi:hypothetical protein